jgi:hypothetical protein
MFECSTEAEALALALRKFRYWADNRPELIAPLRGKNLACWSSPMGKPPAPAADLLDPRQRQAACLLLSAIDLPCEVGAWARQIQQAASVFPGATIDQASLNSRKAGLETARALIDAMLWELNHV